MKKYHFRKIIISILIVALLLPMVNNISTYAVGGKTDTTTSIWNKPFAGEQVYIADTNDEYSTYYRYATYAIYRVFGCNINSTTQQGAPITDDIYNAITTSGITSPYYINGDTVTQPWYYIDTLIPDAYYSLFNISENSSTHKITFTAKYTSGNNYTSSATHSGTKSRLATATLVARYKSGCFTATHGTGLETQHRVKASPTA